MTTRALLLTSLLTSTALAADPSYPFDQPNDKHFVTNTAVLERAHPSAGNNQSYKIATPRAQVKATFTKFPITVDGIREPAWDAATPYPITHKFNAPMTAAAPDASTQGTLRALWDGPVLYLLVEVTGDATKSDTATPNWNQPSYSPNSDGLFVFMDVFNDQWGFETDTQGVFFLGANPALTSVTSYNNNGIPSLGSFFNPANQDYCPRLKAFKSSGYHEAVAGERGRAVNYTYEIALQIRGWGDEWNRPITNGTQIGLEVGIYDQGNSFAFLSKSEYFGGREGNSNLPNSERIRNRDWGVVTLDGWDGTTFFPFSSWPADEAIRFWDSKANPGGAGGNGDASLVWAEKSKARMVAAKSAWLAVKDKPAMIDQKDLAVLEVCRAFAALRWADTKYPDPHDLTALQTLPNPWQFFDRSKGVKGMVTNAQQWADRKQEILDLAQFYEYGYKPKLTTDYTITITTNTYAGTAGGGNPTIGARITPTNAHFSGGIPLEGTITVTLPANIPEGQKAPIFFGGNAPGLASIGFPNWATDNRTDAGAWGAPTAGPGGGAGGFGRGFGGGPGGFGGPGGGPTRGGGFAPIDAAAATPPPGNRTGTYYQLFPYARNSTSADSSILIANATAVSIYLDILQAACVQNPQLAAKIDPSKAVTKGFSIGGKNAFVAAIFDDRVKVCLNGGSGATGPANWRYNAQGQEFDFSDSPFNNPGAQAIIAYGTEGPGNSYRHNRVRETELFRHFMPYGHMYAHEDRSYAYGHYSSLPFDQSLLVATLAPDRAILIDTNLNDYNDGAMTDNMSLQISKSVYKTLGVDPNQFVKFNSGNYVSNGDPHGSAPIQIENKFLSDFFFHTQTLTEAEATRLNTDPYNLKVANKKTQTPYDYYWSGFNTITGGKTGPTGTDGWYFYKLP